MAEVERPHGQLGWPQGLAEITPGRGSEKADEGQPNREQPATTDRPATTQGHMASASEGEVVAPTASESSAMDAEAARDVELTSPAIPARAAAEHSARADAEDQASTASAPLAASADAMGTSTTSTETTGAPEAPQSSETAELPGVVGTPVAREVRSERETPEVRGEQEVSETPGERQTPTAAEMPGGSEASGGLETFVESGTAEAEQPGGVSAPRPESRRTPGQLEAVEDAEASAPLEAEVPQEGGMTTESDVAADAGEAADGAGDGLGAVAHSWDEDLPGEGYEPQQRLRSHRPRGAEAAAEADVQSRFLGGVGPDDRKSRLASAWKEPISRPVADAAIFGEAGASARTELAEMAASVTSDDPVSRETAPVDVVETFRVQEAAAPAAEPTEPPVAAPPTTEAAPMTSPSHASGGTTPPQVDPHQLATRPSATREPLPRPARTRVMTVANQKGGVGKTTTTVNVAAALAQSGLRVLVLDLDPQGNASTALGIAHHAEVPSVYDVLVDGAPVADVVQACPDVPNLWCAPATIDLAGAEIELVSLVAREMRLGRALTAYLRAMDDAGESIDYVLIDCPPSLGLLTINAFVAADEVFIPIQCEYYALEGLSQLLKNIELIKAHLNPGLHVSTILLTMYDGRTRLSAQVADEVRRHFGPQVIGSTVPRSVRISEAPSHGQTVMTYDPASSGALSYAAAAVEIARQGAGEEGDR